jgi:hypothetical protein
MTCGPQDRREQISPDTPQGWVGEEEMRMSLVHKQLPSFLAAHPGNHDLLLVRIDFTCIGVRGGGSRK